MNSPASTTSAASAASAASTASTAATGATGACADGCCVLEAPLDEEAATALAERLKAVADPVRLRLLSRIATAPTGELCACVLPDELDRSQPTISHHLAQLTKVGLIERTQRGKWAWFRLADRELADLRAALGEGAEHRHIGRPTVLFLCGHNAGRSQMAAGFLRHVAGDRIEVRSAGSNPGDALNPAAVTAMSEVGIDISSATPQRWTPDMALSADVVISMGCGDDCPIAPGARRDDWDVPDPAGQPIEFVRPVRDEIAQRVDDLVAELTPSCCA